MPIARSGLVLLLATSVFAAEELLEERDHSLRPAIREPTAERVKGLHLPRGFTIRLFAEHLEGARMLAVGPTAPSTSPVPASATSSRCATPTARGAPTSCGPWCVRLAAAASRC